MIEEIEEFSRHVAIVGFKNVRISNLEGFFEAIRKKAGDTQIQFFDANLIAGWKHIYFATLNALNAFKNRQNFSNSLAMEALLFASAQRQIRRAMELIGIKPKSSCVAVLIVDEEKGKASATLEAISGIHFGERDDSVLDLTNEKIENIRELFKVSDLELKAKLEKEGLEKEALLDLVIERTALLVTQH